MLRALKFIGIFAGTLLLVLLIVFGFNIDALTTLFNNSEDLQEGQEWVSKTTSLKGLTEYIGENPQHSAIASRSVTNPDTTIAYGENEPHTMGTLSNFFLITTYARLVEEGQIDPEELISLDEIDRYQLPYIDASSHTDAKAALENQGSITNENQAPLNELIEKAIIFNNLAISDFLYYKLGPNAIRKTLEQLETTSTEPPLPFAGLYITLNPTFNDTSFETHFNNLQDLSDEAFRDSVRNINRRYLDNQQFHNSVNNIFAEQQGLGIGFTERRDALSLFPQSTASELSLLMKQLEQDRLISEAVSKRVKDILEWPYEEQSLNSDFEYYGAIYDNRLGLLSGIDYGASVYSSEPFAQAVFFDSLQVAFWFHMSSNLLHQDYQQRLMWDPALRTATMQEIGK